MRVAFEALAWGRHINDYRDSWEVVRRADHKAVGLVLDSFHICSRKSPLDAIRSIPGDRMFLVQMADAPMLDMDVLSWSRHFRNFPGQGAFPLVDFVEALQATGFDGSLSLEIFNDQFRAGSARRVAIDGHRSLIFLLDQLRARTGQASMPGVALPPRSKVLGTSFIEFAIDETTQPAFETMLRGLGFARAGVHKSKSVTRWNQGAINVVVNTEKEGFAHSFNITHGTSVCAIGLEVTDATATLDRAQRLLDQPFRQAVGPGELEIPAVRGLGGSLVYFIDPKSDLARVWDIEFKPTGEDANAATGDLKTVDHISQSMQYEEMLTWLLFYTSTLDLDKSGEQDVIDPGGLVKSQVVQSADGALRVVLNASQSSHTQSSRFLADAFGSGVQHIAFATDDLLATVARHEGQRRQAAGDPGELLRRPRGQDRPHARAHRAVEGAQRAVRPRGQCRVPAGLYPDLRGRLLLRDRRAQGLQRLRRRQRADPAGRASAHGKARRHAAEINGGRHPRSSALVARHDA